MFFSQKPWELSEGLKIETSIGREYLMIHQIMRAKAVLFGLNYAHTANARLSGCINDVNNMAHFLQNTLSIPCEKYTDDTDLKNTSGMGILSKLYELAVDSHKLNLEFVWIHYSGHGSYIVDRSTDERDGKDEALVPSDFETRGVIPDDFLQSLFRYFNPKTRVVCVFDCCHSGTIGDVKYSWEGPRRVTVENIMCAVKAPVITLSGCLDEQVSMDAYNVLKDNQFSGAMTSCLLICLRENPNLKGDAFALVSELRKKLAERGFKQVPKLCSSYNLAKVPSFMP